MPGWKRNQPVASLRRATLFVYDQDGAPAPATTLFTGTGELLVDKGDGDYIAALGTLSTTKRPLIVADDVVEAVDTVNERLTLTAHGLLTGDGPIQFTTTGALPGGIVAATDYWVIKFDANAISLATSLANALLGTKVDLTSAGSGVNTLVDTASTKRLNDGAWVYEASQAEINYRGSYFAIRIAKTNFKDSIYSVDLDQESQVHAGTAAAGAAQSVTLDAGASALNNFYLDAVIVIVGGTGAGQVNTITTYTGATKVAGVNRVWVTNPDATSQFMIVPAAAGANPTSVAASVWAAVGEGAYTYGDLVRAILSLSGCVVGGFTTGVMPFKSINGAKTRWTVNASALGRDSIVVGDLTP